MLFLMFYQIFMSIMKGDSIILSFLNLVESSYTKRKTNIMNYKSDDFPRSAWTADDKMCVFQEKTNWFK